MPLGDELLKLINLAAVELPPTALSEIIRALESATAVDANSRQRLSGLAPTPGGRHLIGRLLYEWGRGSPGLTGAGLAAALEAAAYAERATKQELSVQLVWTGPTEDVPLRMTSQVLLQLIEEAQKDLLIVSFAVYNIPDIVNALLKAVARGVRLRIVAETPDESEGKVVFGALPALGNALVNQAQIYVWPREKRPTDAQGRHGSLHVKCVVGDGRTTYVTSANLTGYAMRLNMEMGVLILNEDFACQVRQHVDGLIQQKVLIPLR